MIEKENKFQNIFINKWYRILFHFLFWAVYVGSITLFFGGMASVGKVFIRTLISAAFNAILVYLNLYYFLPVYFEKNKYLKYVIYLNISVIAISFLRVEADMLYSELFPGNGFVKQFLFTPAHYISIFISCYLLILLTSSIRFIKEYFENIRLREKIKYQQLEAELRNLKSQLNPHFLFNVLNNIYSLAYMKSDKTGAVILKLSDMMRYVLYECSGERVPLKNEIEYLKNYLDLHQLKKEENMNIEFKITGNPDGIMIEPLLFLPLFENCFKHGNMEDTENGWMKSEMVISEKYLNLWIKNSVAQTNNNNGQPGGIGVKNIKERLKMIYGDKCQFTEVSKENEFMVSVMIELSDKNYVIL